MKINNALLERVLRLKPSEEIACDSLGLVNHGRPNMLTFVDDERFLQTAVGNPNVSAMLVTEAIAKKMESNKIAKIVSEDPRYDFYTLMNFLSAATYRKIPSVIDPTATVHPTAYVSEFNVEIGKNVLVEPKVTILPDVVIGDNCIIRAGAVLGSEGYEHKLTTRGVLSVFHDGKVVLGRNVEVGSNSTLDKGFSFRHTIIGDSTKIDNLVHVSHCVQAGKNCFIIACSMISGSVTIGDNVWIGPNATIAPYLTIENGSFVTLGSVVTQRVLENQWVTGNFAIPHNKFLYNLKKILSASRD